MTPWHASLTWRWHAGEWAAYLAHTGDTVGGHSHRMAVLALQFWPDCTRELLAACIKHDLGESGPGDAPHDAKQDPTLKATLDRLEDAQLARLGMTYSVSADDAQRLRFLDRLDAYQWVELRAPQIMWHGDWVTANLWLNQEAEALGVKR